MLPILIITCSVTSEEYSSHSSTRALLSVDCVEAVDKLVEVVGRLHDGAQESDESHIVALGEELGSESVRLQHWQPGNINNHTLVAGTLRRF